jgi:hypothetical protein
VSPEVDLRRLEVLSGCPEMGLPVKRENGYYLFYKVKVVDGQVRDQSLTDGWATQENYSMQVSSKPALGWSIRSQLRIWPLAEDG